ncbi:mannose-1-phosphate guanylyltransferase (GDP) /mannose-6-phosphate isomerase, type 2 [Azomonas agilis]|uniref:Alginate biosynthesis protein AlgA n=1 Tax=Azomonas agilis TaxID=116849 RepID=A0A562HZL8_9GAMM|nr:mannose-1-phosphate guanylyltransferase/mannose-6-phosphate isomerase [Azomonas agilis]TWH64211.1 mannose-1-phosphate guanylyltransferase (GDP) /mannose-6-phosphate isomerase, type 2 [Azomonas agilis]
MHRRFHPVILSGGSGTRLWPLSRAAMPKQLLALTEQASLLQATIRRVDSIAGAQSSILICNNEHRFLIREQLQEIQHTPASIILEPIGRNTAPAIALAALKLMETDPEAVMLVLPADHVIDDQAAFKAAVYQAIPAAEAGYLVTFGIVPTHPETGYGYIRMGEALSDLSSENPSCQVLSFVEKPDQQTAQRFLAEGNYVWNSGMFVLTARRYLDELQTHRPDIFEAVAQAWKARTDDLGFCRPDQEAFVGCPSDSIDYAVMQSTQQAAVIPASFGWSDVGSWASLWQIADKDAEGNCIQGDVFVSDTQNSYVRAEHRHVAVIGLEDVVVVETADAVLVMHRDKAQEVKRAIQFFEQSQRREHLEHVRVYRPWGWYEGMDKGERFQVKRIMVKPGERLSLQMHHHRAEHWVVVSGTAKVTVEGKELLLTENQSTYIPLGHVHCLENPGRIELHLVEVQSGAYLGEDDIVRLQDEYGRTSS